MDIITPFLYSTRMKAYSYVRWSSDEQTSGDSLTRQILATKQMCQEKGWIYDESLKADAGVSAYKGDNIQNGSLAKFISEVESKRIETPCILVVEALDRLTRTSLKDARNLFEKLLELDVQICTANNRKIYTKQCLDNPIDMMMSLMEMNAAHEYSKTLGMRSRAAWQRKKDSARNGVVLTRKIPAWVSLPENSKATTDFKLVRDRVKVVKRVFREYLKGIGSETIALSLTREGVKPFGCAKVWNVSSVFRLLKSVSVTGVYQPQYHSNRRTRTDEGAPIADYYPRVIDDETFYLVQEQLRTKLIPRGPKKHCYNLFSGLLFCKKCGGRMVLKAASITKKRKTPNLRIVCSTASRGGECEYVSLKYRELEETLIQGFSGLIITKKTSFENTSEGKFLALQGELNRADEQIAKFEKVMNDTSLKAIPPQIIEGLNVWGRKQKTLQEQLALPRSEFDKKHLHKLVMDWRPMERTKENRQAVQTLLRSFIERIIIDPKREQAEIEWRIFNKQTTNLIKWKKTDPKFIKINDLQLLRTGKQSQIWLEEGATLPDNCELPTPIETRKTP